MGLAALMYRLTGNHTYVDIGQMILNNSLSYFGNGTWGDRWHQQPADFNSIWFRNALLLESTMSNDRSSPSNAGE